MYCNGVLCSLNVIYSSGVQYSIETFSVSFPIIELYPEPHGDTFVLVKGTASQERRTIPCKELMSYFAKF